MCRLKPVTHRKAPAATVLTCRRRRRRTAAITIVYADISGGFQPRESAARGNFRSAARATNYSWHRADYSSRCSHPQQIARDRAPRHRRRRRGINVVCCLTKESLYGLPPM